MPGMSRRLINFLLSRISPECLQYRRFRTANRELVARLVEAVSGKKTLFFPITAVKRGRRTSSAGPLPPTVIFHKHHTSDSRVSCCQSVSRILGGPATATCQRSLKVPRSVSPQAFFDSCDLALEPLLVEKAQLVCGLPHPLSPGVTAVRASLRLTISAWLREATHLALHQSPSKSTAQGSGTTTSNT